MGERETWTTEEFGTSHEGTVGVLLADGSVPGPAYFDTRVGAPRPLDVRVECL
ncbi:hypothetical protein [Streptomyces sp. NBC_01443]|uniref:hypothetical protein n=1 Tax=Streptomyces sp. NBC_01443 TaxID=2903868 RepID=UPI00224EA9FE|nr:hypothetical protein [Streptomyces sp. NBC_01443]MCX4632043.1 hypothetical protein [Streptomyces sp. NBC_01443]